MINNSFCICDHLKLLRLGDDVIRPGNTLGESVSGSGVTTCFS